LETTTRGVLQNQYEEYYKINIDGAFSPKIRTGDRDFVVQNTKGEVSRSGEW
jgi:hypothetical protein